MDNYLPILTRIMKNRLIFSVENKEVIHGFLPQKRLISAFSINTIKTGKNECS